MERNDLLKFIPKPENKDVIIYDISLKDLIEINVEEEYIKEINNFKLKKDEYEISKKAIEQYQNIINNIYLYKKNWSEENYLSFLQDDKITYSKLYGDVKKLENKITILNKKIADIDYKIKIQIAKDTKSIQETKEKIEDEIGKNKEDLQKLKDKLELCKDDLDSINRKIEENQEDFKIYQDMNSQLEKGTFICKCCGHQIKKVSENSYLFNRLYNNLENNKKQLEKLLQKKEKIQTSFDFYKDEISKIKIELSNNTTFKKQDFNLYQKKSLVVLRLEAQKDEILKELENTKKELEKNENTHKDHYIRLKENIKNYEQSIENLKKIKEYKEQIQDKIKTFNSSKEELKIIISKLEKYKKFLSIFFKIYEQKAAEYCGTDFKFKIFEFDNYELKPIFKIYYKSIDYEQLSKKSKDDIDKFLIQKFELFD